VLGFLVWPCQALRGMDLNVFGMLPHLVLGQGVTHARAFPSQVLKLCDQEPGQFKILAVLGVPEPFFPPKVSLRSFGKISPEAVTFGTLRGDMNCLVHAVRFNKPISQLSARGSTCRVADGLDCRCSNRTTRAFIAWQECPDRIRVSATRWRCRRWVR
jgi:hypothetical protein